MYSYSIDVFFPIKRPVRQQHSHGNDKYESARQWLLLTPSSIPTLVVHLGRPWLSPHVSPRHRADPCLSLRLTLIKGPPYCSTPTSPIDGALRGQRALFKRIHSSRAKGYLQGLERCMSIVRRVSSAR
jgi:hypothetical protein